MLWNVMRFISVYVCVCSEHHSRCELQRGGRIYEFFVKEKEQDVSLFKRFFLSSCSSPLSCVRNQNSHVSAHVAIRKQTAL